MTNKEIIEAAWSDRALLQDQKTIDAIDETIAQIDSGALRCAEPTIDGWQVNEWVKKAVVLYFPLIKM